MTPGTRVIISSPSLYYERWRDQPAKVIDLKPTHIDVILVGKKDYGLRLRVEPQSVRK
jgi:hypothetical protein